MQSIAAVSSLLGILIGKYITVFHIVKTVVLKDGGKDLADKVTFFSEGVWKVFWGGGLQSLVNGFDILWVILAVSSAWGLLKANHLAVPSLRRNTSRGEVPSSTSPRE